MTNGGSQKDNMRFMEKYQVMYACGKKSSDIQRIERSWPICVSRGLRTVIVHGPGLNDMKPQRMQNLSWILSTV